MKDKLYPWMVLSVTGLGNLLSGLNLSTLNVVLPEVASHFQAGASTGSWILLRVLQAVGSALIITNITPLTK